MIRTNVAKSALCRKRKSQLLRGALIQTRSFNSAMTALPPSPYSPATLWDDAYNKCLTLESAVAPSIKTFPPLIRARFLGYMILKAPTDEGRTNVSTEVRDCVDDAALFQLAAKYKYCFLHCCWYLPLSFRHHLTWLSCSFGSQRPHACAIFSSIQRVL